MRTAALSLIRLYQRSVSPTLPAACRFEPSCSNYGHDAIAKYGVLKGGWLAARRLGRCHPFSSAGYDPVP